MKKVKFLSGLFVIVVFSIFTVSSCELFENFEEIDLYGTWNIEQISVDMDINGDNFLQVMAARIIIKAAQSKLNNEMNEQIDSLGGSITFNPDYTFSLELLQEADTGTWYFNEAEKMILLTADNSSLDELNIEKLNTDQLILNWISEEEEFTDDSTDESFSVQITIEAQFSKE